MESICEAAIQANSSGVFFYEYLNNSGEYPEQEKHFGMLKENRKSKIAWEECGNVIKNIDELVEKEGEVSVMGRFLSNFFNREIFYGPFNSCVDLLVRSELLTSLFGRIANSELTFGLMELLG